MQKFTNKIWGAFKTAGRWLLRYPIALVVSIGVILFASTLMLLGVGDRFNLGGVLGWLFGHDDTDESDVKRSNKVPDERVDDAGNTIPKGEPDEDGWVQQDVDVVDHSHNPFRDKSKLEVIEPDGKTKKIRLPKGVKDTDVEQVIQIQPSEFEVVVKGPSETVNQDTVDYLKS